MTGLSARARHEIVDQISELEAHQRAYLQIFRAILKKKNATPEQANALLGKLKQYIAARIKAPDDFLDHIPNFAKGLAVRPEALSSYIGSNLLPALDAVKRQMREAAATAVPAGVGAGPRPGGGAAISDAEIADSLLKELERDVGTIITDHHRFSGEDMGLLRLVALNGGEDIPSKSLREAMGMPAGEPDPAPASAKSVTGSVPVASPSSAVAGAASASKPAPMVIRETSILQEILEQFGDDLIVTGTLQVPAFPRNQSDGAASSAPAPAGVAASVPDAAGTTGGAASAADNTAAVASAQAPVVDAEPSLIGEILEQFGDELTVRGPLVLPEGGGTAGAQHGGPPVGMAPAAGADPDQPAAAPPASVELPEVVLSFQQYMDVVRKLQEFQASGDQDAYRNWLTNEAREGGKAVVGLRNVDARAKRGDEVNWADEYYKIAHHMNLESGQIEGLHQRIARFQKLQQLLNQFIGSVKTKDPALVGAVKKIWPQVRLLFNEDWNADSMMSRLKIPLLQIMDPALKSQVQSLMLPLLQKAESLAKAS